MLKSILLIDDDARLAAALKTRLEASGYRVHTAFCGEDGLTAAAQCRPNAIVLDIRMPGIDGYEVCRRLRADPKLCATPIIIMSAIVHESSRRAVFEAGANQFIPKPYEATLVLAAIRKLTEGHGEKDLQDQCITSSTSALR